MGTTPSDHETLGTEPSGGRLAGQRRSWLEDLYTRHWKDLCRNITAKFGAGPPDPEDVAQQAFIKLSAEQHFSSIRDPKAFLYRVAHNIAIDYGRYTRRRERILQENTPVDAESSDDLDPQRVLLNRGELTLLEQAIERLPAKQREFLLMNRLEGLSYAEIARRAKVSPSGVRKLVEQAMTACLKALKDKH